MKEFHILNLGAGVQSTTLYLMACENWAAFRAGRELPWPEVGLIDFSIFADTQDEPGEVYRHLHWLCSKARRWSPYRILRMFWRVLDYLQQRQGPPILIRTKGKLSEDLIKGVWTKKGTRFASIPAYTTTVEGKLGGMTRRQCSKEYKIEVIQRTIRREILGLKPKRTPPKTTIIHQYFGISLDEAGRAGRIEAAPRAAYLRVHFPFIKMLMVRAQCITLLVERFKVPHRTPKSACVHCPYRTDAEWMKVKEVPEDWQLAVSVDESLRVNGSVANRHMKQKMYLHRSCQPLVQIEFKPSTDPREQQININFNQECMGVCGV